MKAKWNLILPTEFSEELAEETGIHIGDGGMNVYKYKKKNHWEYVHSSHLVDDREYRQYVKILMKKLYNLEPYEKIQRKCAVLVYTRKDLVLFKKNIGLPMGKKENIRIPDWILKNEKFKISCVRGIVDTDGCIRFRKPFKGKIHNYPHIKVTIKSEILIKQLNEIFIDFGLKPSINKEKIRYSRPNVLYTVNLNGVKNVNRYVELIGFSNNKHLDKYLFWKEHGFYTKNKINGGAGI